MAVEVFYIGDDCTNIHGFISSFQIIRLRREAIYNKVVLRHDSIDDLLV